MSPHVTFSLLTGGMMFAMQSLADASLRGAGCLAAFGRYRFAVYVIGIAASAVAAGAGAARTAAAFQLCLLIATLCVCTVTDVESGYILDVVTVPALLGEIVAAALGGAWQGSASGALACSSSIALLYALTKGRGIGLGDLKLAACIGAAFGPAGGITSLGAAFVFGGMHAIVLLSRRRITRGESLRFAPYLSAGSAASLLWSNAIWG